MEIKVTPSFFKVTPFFLYFRLMKDLGCLCCRSHYFTKSKPERVVRVVPPIGRLFEHQVVPDDGMDAQGSTNPRTFARSSPSTASRSAPLRHPAGAVPGAVSRPPGGLCAWYRRSGGCLSTR